MAHKKILVAHIIPAMTVGGVETAVLRSLPEMQKQYDYRIFTVRYAGTLDCGQRSVVHLLINCIFGGWRPDIVITSLWWAHPFGYLIGLFGVKWLAFFHSTGFSRNIDKIVLKWAWRRAMGRLVDSDATAMSMSNQVLLSFDVIPYVFDDDYNTKSLADRNIDLVWIGRNAKVKRLDLVCDFVHSLARYIPQARIALIYSGLSYEPFHSLQRETGSDVDIYHSLDNEEARKILRKSRFYLLVSDHEGMSMSTIEAIQAGCIPVVRPVGELGSYLDSLSAIFIDNSSQNEIHHAAKVVSSLLKDDVQTNKMRTIAQNKLGMFSCYADALSHVILNACNRSM